MYELPPTFLFPLLHLPKDAIKIVIQVMEPLFSLAFTICSKKSRELVQSAGLKCSGFYLTLDRDFGIKIRFNQNQYAWMIFDDEIGFRARYLPVPDAPDHGIYRWNIPEGLGMRHWIDYYLSLVSPKTGPQVINVMFVHSAGSNPIMVREQLSGIRVNGLFVTSHNVSDEYSEQFMNQFPLVNDLHLGRLPARSFPNIYLQNFNSLQLPMELIVTFNDLLMMNSVYLTVTNPAMSLIELNRFIKLWMRGGTNLRMKHLNLIFFLEMEMNLELIRGRVLDGLNHRVAADDEQRIFQKNFFNRNDEITVNRGDYILRQTDNVDAAIRLAFEHTGRFAFNMYIWS